MLFILIGSRSVETESCRLTKFGFSWKRNGQDGGRFSCSFLIGDWLLRHFSVQSTAGNDVGCPRLWSRRRREDDERNLRWFFCFLFFFVTKRTRWRRRRCSIAGDRRRSDLRHSAGKSRLISNGWPLRLPPLTPHPADRWVRPFLRPRSRFIVGINCVWGFFVCLRYAAHKYEPNGMEAMATLRGLSSFWFLAFYSFIYFGWMIRFGLERCDFQHPAPTPIVVERTWSIETR